MTQGDAVPHGVAPPNSWDEALGGVRDLIYQNDTKGRVQWVSGAVVDVLGHQPADLVGTDMMALVHPEDRPTLDRLRQATLSGGEVETIPVRFRSSGGEWRELATRKLPLWSGGEVTGELVTLRDEQEIHAVRQAFLTVMACNEVLVRAGSEQELLEQTCRAVAESGGYAFAWYGVPRHDADHRVDPVAVGGEDYGYTEQILVSWDADSPHGQGPTGICLRTGTTQVRNDLSSDPRYGPWRAAVAQRGVCCSITLPVHVSGQVHGALMVYGHRSGEFGRLAQTMLEGLAADLGYGLERLADANRRLEAEQQFRLLAESITDAVVSVDEDLACDWASPSCAAVLGWAPEELVGRAAVDFLHPDDLVAATAAIAASPPGEPLMLRVRFRRPDGDYTWLSAAGRAIRDQGGELLTRVVSLRDIASEVRAEEALARSEALYRLLVENSVDVVFQTVDGVLTWVSPSVESMLGYPPDALLGRDVREVWGSEVREVPERLLWAESGDAPSVETFPMHDANGRLLWLEVTIRPFRKPDGTAGSTGTVREVSARVEAQRALETAEAEFRLIAEHALDVVIRTDADGTITWVSPSVRDALDWDPAELLGTHIDELMHGDDAAALRPGSAGQWGATSGEVRLCDRHGAWRWMRLHRTLVSNQDGTAAGTIDSLRDIDHEVRTRLQAAFEARHDPLTGLLNRSGLFALLESTLSNDGSDAALVTVGVDNLHQINAAYTHSAGDRVLIEVAKMLVEVVGSREVIARSGDNEFSILVTHADTSALTDLAVRVRDAGATRIRLGAQEFPITVSVGIALASGRRAGELVRDASTALHQAREAGGRRWEFLDPGIAAEARRRLTIHSGLNEALDAGQIRPWFQAVVDLTDERVRGYEALARWIRADGTVVAPGAFLPVAEQSDQILAVDRVMLAGALTTLIELPAPLHMAANISAATLADPGLVEHITGLLAATGVDPARVQLEVTETALLRITPDVLEAMRAVAALGITWWVDDFGTGYSSLVHLRDLPIGGLKLDRSFTAGVETDASTHHRLAHGLLGLAHGLGLRTLAEGVETQAQADALRAQGWELAQGWLYAKPAPLGGDVLG